MKNQILGTALCFGVMLVFLAACNPQTETAPVTPSTVTVPPDTSTPVPTITPTPVPLRERDLSSVVLQPEDLDDLELDPSVYTGEIRILTEEELENLLFLESPEMKKGAVNYLQVSLYLQTKEQSSAFTIQIPNYTNAIIVYESEERASTIFSMLSQAKKDKEGNSYQDASNSRLGSDCFLVYDSIYDTFPFSDIYWRYKEAVGYLRAYGGERPQEMLEKRAEPVQLRLSGSSPSSHKASPTQTTEGAIVGEISDWGPLGHFSANFTAEFGGVEFKLKEHPGMIFQVITDSFAEAAEVGVMTRNADGFYEFQELTGWRVELTCEEGEDNTCNVTSLIHLNPSDISTTPIQGEAISTPTSRAEATPTPSYKSIHRAAFAGDTGAVQAFLDAGVEPRARDDEWNRTPAHWAADGGHIEVLELLRKNNGIRAAEKDGNGATLLHIATANGDAEVVRYLVDRHLCSLFLMDNRGGMPIHIAAANGELGLIELFLSEGMGVNTVSGGPGGTALHWAAANNHKQVVEYLLDQGADPAKLDKQGMTAGEAAQEGGFTAVASILQAAETPPQDSEEAPVQLLLDVIGHQGRKMLVLDWDVNAMAANLELDSPVEPSEIWQGVSFCYGVPTGSKQMTDARCIGITGPPLGIPLDQEMSGTYVGILFEPKNGGAQDEFPIATSLSEMVAFEVLQ